MANRPVGSECIPSRDIYAAGVFLVPPLKLSDLNTADLLVLCNFFAEE